MSAAAGLRHGSGLNVEFHKCKRTVGLNRLNGAQQEKLRAALIERDGLRAWVQNHSLPVNDAGRTVSSVMEDVFGNVRVDQEVKDKLVSALESFFTPMPRAAGVPHAKPASPPSPSQKAEAASETAPRNTIPLASPALTKRHLPTQEETDAATERMVDEHGGSRLAGKRNGAGPAVSEMPQQHRQREKVETSSKGPPLSILSGAFLVGIILGTAALLDTLARNSAQPPALAGDPWQRLAKDQPVAEVMLRSELNLLKHSKRGGVIAVIGGDDAARMLVTHAVYGHYPDRRRLVIDFTQYSKTESGIAEVIASVEEALLSAPDALVVLRNTHVLPQTLSALHTCWDLQYARLGQASCSWGVFLLHADGLREDYVMLATSACALDALRGADGAAAVEECRKVVRNNGVQPLVGSSAPLHAPDAAKGDFSPTATLRRIQYAVPVL